MPSARVRYLILDLLLCSVSVFARDLPRFLSGQLTLRKVMDCHFKSNPVKLTPSRVREHVLLTLAMVTAYVESRVVPGEPDVDPCEVSPSRSLSPSPSSHLPVGEGGNVMTSTHTPTPVAGGGSQAAWEGEDVALLPLLPAAVLTFVGRFEGQGEEEEEGEYAEEVTGLLWLLEEVLAVPPAPCSL
jgi:hypothetical protein